MYILLQLYSLHIIDNVLYSNLLHFLLFKQTYVGKHKCSYVLHLNICCYNWILYKYFYMFCNLPSNDSLPQPSYNPFPLVWPPPGQVIILIMPPSSFTSVIKNLFKQRSLIRKIKNSLKIKIITLIIEKSTLHAKPCSLSPPYRKLKHRYYYSVKSVFTFKGDCSTLM